MLRQPAQTALLEEAGEASHLSRLQGFLVFGTAHRLAEKIGGRLAWLRTVPLRRYAMPIIWQAGDLDMGQDERSTAMHVIELGQLTESLALADGWIVRLRPLFSGTVVGEVGCYLNVPRTLTMVAERIVRARAIDRDGLERIRPEAPDLAADSHLGLVRVTAARLAALTRYLEHHDR